MNLPDKSYTQQEIDIQTTTLLNEMHELLKQSKANPSIEISQKLAECFQKMDALQHHIKQQINVLRSED